MNEFYEAVVKMREAQKRYFRVRSATALTEAKESEDVVDHMIREKNAAAEHPLLSKGVVIAADLRGHASPRRMTPIPNLPVRQEPQA